VLGANSKWQIGRSIYPSNSIINGFSFGSRCSNDITSILAISSYFTTSVGVNFTWNSSSHPAAIVPYFGEIIKNPGSY